MGAWWEQTSFSQLPGKGSSFRTCCCNQRLWLLPAQVKKHQALSQITRSAPQTSLCPNQLYYHMHKNIYCFTSYFSVKVNRNWLGVASQILTVEPEAQHKYRGASECKCLLWILESSSAWAAGSVCVRSPPAGVHTHLAPSTGTCLHAQDFSTHGQPSHSPRNSNANRHENRQHLHKSYWSRITTLQSNATMKN